LKNRKEKNIILVDKNDNFIGLLDKFSVHKKGLLHRAFSIFIMDNFGKILLQKRNYNKYHCGGLWSNACCGHPSFNDKNIIQAGIRRLNEEIGCSLPLFYKGSFIYYAKLNNGLIEHEFDHVLLGILNKKKVILNINPEEVSQIKWMSFYDIQKKYIKNPKIFTPWFIKVFNFVMKEKIWP